MGIIRNARRGIAKSVLQNARKKTAFDIQSSRHYKFLAKLNESHGNFFEGLSKDQEQRGLHSHAKVVKLMADDAHSKSAEFAKAHLKHRLASFMVREKARRLARSIAGKRKGA